MHRHILSAPFHGPPDIAFKSTLLLAADIERVVLRREGVAFSLMPATMPPPNSFRPDRCRQE
ncbi:MAG: hypothetical protein AAAC48_05495 [Phyllobacterium sp.]|uniref:hypothetical protein n=1 Tax=Phyllobacterium sp. TaxID=1871046 RepID=UPI0030F2A939